MIHATSLPAGVRVHLSRAPVNPGREPIVDDWMHMLNERLDECVDTLRRERMALELAFRHREPDGAEWIYWLTIQGDDATGNDPESPVDADHVAFARQVKPPGWEALTPQLMLAPDHIRTAMVARATEGTIRS